MGCALALCAVLLAGGDHGSCFSFAGLLAGPGLPRPNLRGNMRALASPSLPSAPGWKRALLAGPSSVFEALPPSPWILSRAAASLACAVALRRCFKGVLVRREAYGGVRGSGYSPTMTAERHAAAREEKRNKEASQFFLHQRRIVKLGTTPRDDTFWRKQEQLLFQMAKPTQGINFDAYDQVPVKRRGGQGLERPMQDFQECCDVYALDETLAANIQKCGYSKPTPVQKHAMPAALMGTDVMVSAQTGSGKTAAFLVPVIHTMLHAGIDEETVEGPVNPSTVILAPTRELCQQIAIEAEKLCFRSPVRIAALYGGADAVPQLKQMAPGCDMVIATPGRLEDFLGRGIITMGEVKHLVLDEADRMLDMGFEPQIRSIIQEHGMPRPGKDKGCRQTMMFSATFPKEIQELALDFLEPTYLWIGVGKVGKATTAVDQCFEDVGEMDDEEKFEQLLRTIQQVDEKDGNGKTIVFANSKNTVDDLAWRLCNARVRAVQIHGGLTQTVRDRALMDLRSDRVSILVATDVAARGLDLPGIDHVINYELPRNAEDYVHRVGRTGRIGNTGLATSFVTEFEPALREIVWAIKDHIEEHGSDAGVEPVPQWLETKVLRNRGGPPIARYNKTIERSLRSGDGGGGQRGPYLRQGPSGAYGRATSVREGPGGVYRGRGGGRSRSAPPGRSSRGDDDDVPAWARGLPARRRY